MLTIFADSFATASRIPVKTGPVLPPRVTDKPPTLFKRLLGRLKTRITRKGIEHVKDTCGKSQTLATTQVQ